MQQLKSGLHEYNLREYPPGPDSMDQQAGYCKYEYVKKNISPQDSGELMM